MTLRLRTRGLETLALALLLGLLSALPARAERYRVSFMGMPPFEVGDAAELNPLAPAIPASAQASASPTGAAAANAPSPATVTEGLVLPAEAVPLEAAPRPQGDMDQLTQSDPLPAGEPPAGFATFLAQNYLLSNPVDVEASWRIEKKEPADLGQRERWSNAVVRYALANPGKISNASTDDLEKDAAIRHVATDKGLALRAVPWGPVIGNVAGNADVQVVGRDGIWFDVDYGGQRGWVCGLWARAQ